MKSRILKRSVNVHGHKSSVSLEDAFWADLRGIARAQGCAVSNLIAEIDKGRRHGNLSSAIRIFVLEYFRAKANRQAESDRQGDLEKTAADLPEYPDPKT
jgi:predicted DNA-binding ribbon-helix-helix protein